MRHFHTAQLDKALISSVVKHRVAKSGRKRRKNYTTSDYTLVLFIIFGSFFFALIFHSFFTPAIFLPFFSRFMLRLNKSLRFFFLGGKRKKYFDDKTEHQTGVDKEVTATRGRKREPSMCDKDSLSQLSFAWIRVFPSVCFGCVPFYSVSFHLSSLAHSIKMYKKKTKTNEYERTRVRIRDRVSSYHCVAKIKEKKKEVIHVSCCCLIFWDWVSDRECICEFLFVLHATKAGWRACQTYHSDVGGGWFIFQIFTWYESERKKFHSTL